MARNMTADDNEALACRVLQAERLAVSVGLIPCHPSVTIRHQFEHYAPCLGFPACVCEPALRLDWLWTLDVGRTVQ